MKALADGGLQAEALPLIDIAPALDTQAVRQAWASLASRDFVMFVSANAVEQFDAERPQGCAWPLSLRAGSTGDGTTAALLNLGVPQALIDQPAPGETRESEALWRQLCGRPWQGRRVLVVRGEEGRNWLAQQWAREGAAVDFLVAYRRQLPAWDAAQRELVSRALRTPADHLWLFSSSQAISNLVLLARGADWSGSLALATHPRIAAAATQAGFAQVRVVEPRAEAVAQLCARLESAGP